MNPLPFIIIITLTFLYLWLSGNLSRSIFCKHQWIVGKASGILDYGKISERWCPKCNRHEYEKITKTWTTKKPREIHYTPLYMEKKYNGK